MYPSMLRRSGDLFADFAGLQEGLEELFGVRLPAASSIRAVGRANAFPALNIGTSSEALEIYAFAPGIDPASIDVSVEKGLLVLAGERTSGRDRKESANVYAQERFNGKFRRVVSLPDDADASRVDASYRDGVLKIVVPKHEAAKPRQIRVNA